MPCLFFLLWDSKICASQEQAGPLRLGFYVSGLASLPSWHRMMNAGSFGSIRSEIFSQMKFIIFLGCLSFYLGSPVHIISSFFSHFCLFQNAILHKMLKLGFWNVKLIFLRTQFSLVATFFSLVLLVSLRWYFHLTISYLTLATWHFGSQIVFPSILKVTKWLV